jgi:hypothetical protein
MKSGYNEEKILIWGKTYPELSKKHIETVCTAGVLESGKPVRLYPITYRYLNDGQFTLYQWIAAGIQKNPQDTRSESYKIDCDSMRERMRPTMAIIVFQLAISASVMAQQPHSTHISLIPRSNVSTSKLGKELEHHCPSFDIANDSQKPAYDLEAWDAGRGPKRYKFTLFKDGDRVFSTETRRIAGEVKDVCFYIEKRQCAENISSCIVTIN